MQNIRRNYFSASLVSILFITLLSGAVISEFFQAPVITSKELSNLQFLFTSDQIDGVDNISLASNLGRFSLAKNNGQWIITQPRRINANENTINKLLDSLKNVKIKKIFPKDPINLSNFSLDNPTSTITLKNEEGVNETISFGLINPIDNSTYVVSDSDNAIYHVNAVKFSLEKLDLPSLIDSRVFSYAPNDIRAITVINSGKLRFAFERNKNDIWVSGKSALDDERVQDFLVKLTSFKSNLILDKRTDKMNERIDRYLQKPYFKIIVKIKTGEEIEYDLSWVLSSLPDLNIEKKENFIIRASNREHPFLVSKEYLSVLYKRIKSFRPSPLNKIIY